MPNATIQPAVEGAWCIDQALCADFLTGVYHWGVDNYGDGDTPVVGQQIAAFQGHHQKPWTITQRQFCNNVHKVNSCAGFEPALYNHHTNEAAHNSTCFWMF